MSSVLDLMSAMLAWMHPEGLVQKNFWQKLALEVNEC